MIRGLLPQVAKRITFDSEIIENLYTSLRQFSSDRLEGFGRMANSDLDDVDYLVENNTRDDFSNWGKSSIVESESTA